MDSRISKSKGRRGERDCGAGFSELNNVRGLVVVEVDYQYGEIFRAAAATTASATVG